MRLIEQNRHLSQHRAGFADDGDDGVALEDLKPSLDQDVQVTGGAALVDDERSCGYISLNSSSAIVQNRAHRATLQTLGARLGMRIVIVERIIYPFCPNCQHRQKSRGSVRGSAQLRCRQKIADRLQENLGGLELRG